MRSEEAKVCSSNIKIFCYCKCHIHTHHTPHVVSASVSCDQFRQIVECHFHDLIVERVILVSLSVRDHRLVSNERCAFQKTKIDWPTRCPIDSTSNRLELELARITIGTCQAFLGLRAEGIFGGGLNTLTHHAHRTERDLARRLYYLAREMINEKESVQKQRNSPRLPCRSLTQDGASSGSKFVPWRPPEGEDGARYTELSDPCNSAFSK